MEVGSGGEGGYFGVRVARLPVSILFPQKMIPGTHASI